MLPSDFSRQPDVKTIFLLFYGDLNCTQTKPHPYYIHESITNGLNKDVMGRQFALMFLTQWILNFWVKYNSYKLFCIKALWYLG